MVAAENGALPGGKVGGIADVVRDLPGALAGLGWRTTVLTPEYGLFGSIPGSKPCGSVTVPFAGEVLQINVLELPSTEENVRHLAFAHPRFAPLGPMIYCDDGPTSPFASDAGKFALHLMLTTWTMRRMWYICTTGMRRFTASCETATSAMQVSDRYARSTQFTIWRCRASGRWTATRRLSRPGFRISTATLHSSATHASRTR